MVDFTDTDARLDAIVQRLVPSVAPELILLFGSRAAGTARGDSDYDLMLVLRESTASLETARRSAYDALSGLGISVDVLACSVEQYTRRQHDPGYLSWLIAREGRVLYTTGAVPQRSAVPADRLREERESDGLAEWIRRAESDLRAAQNSLAAAEPVGRDLLSFARVRGEAAQGADRHAGHVSAAHARADAAAGAPVVGHPRRGATAVGVRAVDAAVSQVAIP